MSGPMSSSLMPRSARLSLRGKVFYGTALWSFLAKFVAAGNLLLSMPMVIGAIGKTQFGAWATLSSFVAITAFLDFGLGNAALNLISDAKGRNANQELSSVIRVATLRALKLGGALAIAALIALFVVPWSLVLGLAPELSGEVSTSMAVVLTVIALTIPSSVILRMQLAMDDGARGSRWQMAGHLVALLTVYALCHGGHASLATLCAATVFPPALGVALNCLLFLRRQDWCAGASVTVDAARRLGRMLRDQGWSFFALQLAAALAYSTDLTIISSRLGAADSAVYAASQRVFAVVPSAAALLWAPLWPQYRKALAASEVDWVKRTFRRSLLAAILFASGCAVLIFLAFPAIVALLGRGQIDTPALLNAGFAVWIILDCVGAAIATLLNAANVVHFQLLLGMLFAICCAVAKIILVPRLGISALPWITSATYVVLFLGPLLCVRRGLANTIFKRS